MCTVPHNTRCRGMRHYTGRAGIMKLSKTNYLVYRDCAHNAWVKAHLPEVYKAKPLSVFDQAIIETGNEVDVLARDLFPGGVLIERGDAAGTAQLVARARGRCCTSRCLRRNATRPRATFSCGMRGRSRTISMK